MYAVENTAAKVSATLTDVKPDPANGFGEHGYRKKVGGNFKKEKAWIYDGPKRVVTFPGQQFDQTFEATAIVLNGPMANTYLGSVEWGWTSNDKEKPTLKPLKIVRSGAPTGDFMKAGKKWNDAQFDDGGTKYDTVNLPLTTIESAKKIPHKMKDPELLARHKTVETELAKLDAIKNATDITNLSFEKTALETEMKKRKIGPFAKKGTGGGGGSW